MEGQKYNADSIFEIEAIAEGAPVILLNPGNNRINTAPMTGIVRLAKDRTSAR